MLRFRPWVLATGICLLSGVTSAKAASDAKARTEAFIDALIAVKPTPEEGDLSAADRAANRKAFAALDGYFDFDTMMTEAIGPHRAKMSAEQLSHYKTTFRELIRLVAYPDAGSFLTRAKRKMKSSKTKGKKATVDMVFEVPDEDLDFGVTFYWADTGALRLVDVAFDGASLTKDYQNQFGRIIAKSGVDGLLKKLDVRLAKERKATPL